MTYRYEDIDDEQFQKLCSALIIQQFPSAQCLPVAQPDGGRDAFVRESGSDSLIFQVKWTRSHTQNDDPVKWLTSIVRKESEKIAKLVDQGATRYLLITNVRSTAHPGGGRVDRLTRELENLSSQLDIEMSCWWRDDLDARLAAAPDSLKWKYSEVLTGPEAFQALLANVHRAPSLARQDRILRDAATTQWKDDKNVRFRQAGLENVALTDLFVDVHLTANEHLGAFTGFGPPLQGGQSMGAATYFLGDFHGRAVLHGAPGQGKSTLVQTICQAHRSKLLRLDEYSDELHVKLGKSSGRVVFKVDLRDYAQWLNGYDPFDSESDDRRRRRPTESVDSIESFLAYCLRRDSGGSEVTPDDIKDIADRYPILLALDGLDEVATERLRSRAVQEIERVSERLKRLNSKPQILVTARPSFSKLSEPDPDTFSYLILQPLSENLRIAYLRKWARSQQLDPRSRREVERVFRARSGEPHVRELATNPMQLTILLFLIYQRADSVPRNRTKLYRDYMDRFLDRESTKDSDVNRYRTLLEQVTGYLGWYLQASAESGGENGRMTLGALKRLMRHYLADVGHDTSLVDVLFKAATTRVWVLTSRVQGTFEFDVQPIREYFAAQHLATTAPPPGRGRADKFARFIEMAPRPYWLNTARFMAGFFSPGELGGLVDEVELLCERPEKPFTSRRFARTILSDGIFDEKPRALRRAARVSNDLVGIRILVRDIDSKVTTSLPAERGGGTLAELLQERIVAEPEHPCIHDLCRALTLHRESRQIYSWWSSQLSTLTERKSIAAWLIVAAHLQLDAKMTAEDLHRLTPLEDPAIIRGVLQAGCPLPPDPTLESACLNEVLSGNLIESGVAGRTQVAALSRILDPVRFVLLAANNVEIEQRLYPSTRVSGKILSLDQARRIAASSPLGQALSTQSRARGPRGTTAPWGDTARLVQHHLGRNWLSQEIAVIGASARSLNLGGEFSPTSSSFGASSDPGTLLRDIYLNRKNSASWTRSLALCQDVMDHATWSLAFICNAGESCVADMSDPLSGVLNSLPDSAWRRVANASFRIGASNIARKLSDSTLSEYQGARHVRARLALAHHEQASNPWPITLVTDDESELIRLATQPALALPLLRSFPEVHPDSSKTASSKYLRIAQSAPADTLLELAPTRLNATAGDYQLKDYELLPWAIVSAFDEQGDGPLPAPLGEVAALEDWFAEDE